MNGALAQGTKIFAGLAVLTAIEYAAAVVAFRGAVVALTVIAVAKAWLIVSFFMHVGQLRREEH